MKKTNNYKKKRRYLQSNYNIPVDLAIAPMRTAGMERKIQPKAPTKVKVWAARGVVAESIRWKITYKSKERSSNNNICLRKMTLSCNTI